MRWLNTSTKKGKGNYTGRPNEGYFCDGEPIPGTTTICGLLDKPDLMKWAGRVCTEKAWRIGHNGEPMPFWRDVLYPPRDDAATAGTLLHDLFEAHLNGTEAPPIPNNKIGEEAWRGFQNALVWLHGSALKVVSHERPLVSRKHRYGGTPDAVAIDGDFTMLLDWKSSKGVYSSMILQMAAYRQLLRECEDTEIVGVHIVRFSREHGDFGHYSYGTDILDQGWEVFRRLLELNEPLKAIESRVRG